jgi:hypothetical protein
VTELVARFIPRANLYEFIQAALVGGLQTLCLQDVPYFVHDKFASLSDLLGRPTHRLILYVPNCLADYVTKAAVVC